MLQNAPTGVSWDIIPFPQASTPEITAEVTNVCWRATSAVDRYCRQVLRSTADTEYLNGPGVPRCNVDPDTGNGVLQMRRWPVTSVLAIQVSPNRSFPRAWTPVPAGQWDIRHPLIYSGDSASATAPDGGWTIDVAPGWISWYSCGQGTGGAWSGGGGGRGGQRVQVSYINGWPHTSLTATALAGSATLGVDDVTGWAGAQGFAYDGAATEEVTGLSVSATAPAQLPNGAGTVQAGPGTVTLSSPLAFTHEAGAVISALPADVIEAAVLAAAVQALEGGIDAIVIQDLSGGHSSTGTDIDGMTKRYQEKLGDYRRIV
jgi:hypothetical protein